MSTDYCATHGDEPQAVDLCSCKKAMDRFVENSEETDDSNTAQQNWKDNYPKFVNEWREESNRLDGLKSWQDPGFNSGDPTHFNRFQGNNKSVMSEYLFYHSDYDGKDSDETVVPGSVYMAGLPAKGAYVCNDPFHDKGGDGTACHFFYPAFCKNNDDCVGENTKHRDENISWTTTSPGTIYGTNTDNYTGDCKGTCTGTDCDMLWQCKLTNKAKKRRLEEWVVSYENDDDSANKDYSCHIPYGVDPDIYIDNCSKLKALKLPEEWPQENIQCCANILNVENSEANLDHIQQNCSNKLTQQISQLSAAPPPSSSPSPAPAPAPTPTPSGSDEEDDSDNTLYIVGGIIGLLIFLIIIGVIIFAVAS